MSRQFRKQKSNKTYTIIFFAVIFASLGTYFLLFSHAATLTGDINGDGTVNAFDLSLLLSSYGTNTNCTTNTTYTCDLNSDGKVDNSDLGILQANWGKSSSSPTASPANTVQPYFTASTVDTNGTCTNGCAIEGQQLSVTPGTWTNAPTSYSYQWMDCTTSPGTSTGVLAVSGGNGYFMTLPTTSSCSNAGGAGANSSTYTIDAADVGHALAVIVTATNSSGSTPTTTSGSCATGLMTTQMPTTVGIVYPPASTYVDNGQPGCSPISAVVGSSQYGTGAAGEHFCTNAPITCGFADIANTGPPLGTTLYNVPADCTSPAGPGPNCSQTGSGWTYSSSGGTNGTGLISFTNGATLKNVSVQGNVSIFNVSNVTVEDSDISEWGENSFIVSLGHASNVTIKYDNIYGKDAVTPGDGCADNIRDMYGDSTNVTVTNNNMWYCGADLNNIVNGGWTIDSNYIHDFAFSSTASQISSGQGDHFDGIQWEGNQGLSYTNENPSSFSNNTSLMDAPQTSPMILSTDSSAANTNRQLIHNLLAGGGYCTYGGSGGTYTTTNSTFSNNAYSSIYFGANSTGSADQCSAWYGTVAYWSNGSGDIWSNNIWDDNGGSVSP